MENAEQYVLTSLINEIHEGDEPMAVFVDDWQHRITAAAVRGSMAFLLEHGSDNLQVVVTSRARSICRSAACGCATGSSKSMSAQCVST